MPNYIQYELQTLEPIRITDASVSQLGQTATLCHIPGSTMKGLVINALVSDPDFALELPVLVSNKVRFLNAYLTVAGKELLPSPKGFYEDKKSPEKGKKDKEIENVVKDGKITDGNKRAGLGKYCYLEEDCIHFYTVETSSDLKIKVNLENENEKRNVFRNDYMRQGYHFTGYIAVEDEILADKISEILKTGSEVRLGNGRSAGLGKCKVISCKKTTALPYQEYAIKEDQTNSCYMMLLSHTAMRGETGENAGLNLAVLQKKMDVEELEIKFCSTSIVNTSTFNTTLKTRTASVTAYEMGSVFQLGYKGTLTAERAEMIMNQGIGTNRNEGFGRVLFLKDYEKICRKQKEDYSFEKLDAESVESGNKEEDKAVLGQIASNYFRKILKNAMVQYVVNTSFGKGAINNSQVGVVEGLLSANKYQPEEAVNVLSKYFQHAIGKEEKEKTHKEKNASLKGFGKTVQDILEKPLTETLKEELKEKQKALLENGIWENDVKTILPEAEELKLKQELLLMLIRYDNKKEDE